MCATAIETPVHRSVVIFGMFCITSTAFYYRCKVYYSKCLRKARLVNCKTGLSCAQTICNELESKHQQRKVSHNKRMLQLFCFVMQQNTSSIILSCVQKVIFLSYVCLIYVALQLTMTVLDFRIYY